MRWRGRLDRVPDQTALCEGQSGAGAERRVASRSGAQTRQQGKKPCWWRQPVPVRRRARWSSSCRQMRWSSSPNTGARPTRLFGGGWPKMASSPAAGTAGRRRICRPHGGRTRPQMVCFDESPVQLIGEARQPIPAESGRLERYDFEYLRNGTINLFVLLDVHRSWQGQSH